MYESFWYKSDLVVECAASDVDHRALATFKLVIFGLEDEEGKVLTLSKESAGIWNQNGLLKLWVYNELHLYRFWSKLRLIRPKDLNELVIVATSESLTDFAYISLAKEQLALETPADNRQYLK